MTYTFQLTEHPIHPSFLSGFERRSFQFDILGSREEAIVERYFSVVNGVEDAGSETIRIYRHEGPGGHRYNISAAIAEDGTAGTTSVEKLNPERNRRMENGMFQELMNEVCAFYKSKAGQKAWRKQAVLDIDSEITQHRNEIERLRRLFEERIAE